MKSKRKLISKVISLINEVDKKYIYISLVTTLIIATIPAISLKVMQFIINGIQTKNVEIKEIKILIIIYVLINALNYIVGKLIGLYKFYFKQNLNLYISKEIMVVSSRLKLKDFENSETYNIIRKAETESLGSVSGFVDLIFSIFQSIISIVSYIYILSIVNKSIIIFVMFIPIISFLINKKLILEKFNIRQSRINDFRKVDYYKYLLTNSISFKELKINNLFNYFIDKYTNKVKQFNSMDLEIEKKHNFIYLCLNILDLVVEGITFLIMTIKGYNGEIFIGDVITVINGISNLKSGVSSILGALNNLSEYILSLEILFEFLELDNMDGGYKGIDIEIIENIRLDNVSFKYDENLDYVLENISVSLNKGEFVAIVGRNGSGKTTLIKLIMGFYDDYEGDIYINGYNLKNINKQSYFKNITTLFQDFIKYESSIRDNISYNNLNMINDDKKLMELTTTFQLTDFINRQPLKLDTQLGFLFDGGKQLSFGEWQKIALSRAMAKEATAIFLDEPNAALDPISEYELSILYKKILFNKLGVVIAHKFNNFIKDVDKIIILEEGKIIGIGDHQELMASNENYKNFFEIQL